jgi:hypothetical protein
MKYLAALLMAASACGSSTPHGPRDIALTVGSDPNAPLIDLIYRDGSGPWQAPAPNDDGTYALTVTDTYEVFAVFDVPYGYRHYDIEEIRATVDDAPPAIAISHTPDDGYGSAPQPHFHVSGGIVDGGGVVVDTPPGALIPYATWSETDFVVPAFDTSSFLFAVTYNGSTPTSVVRRSFEPGQDTSVPLISMELEARPLTSQPVGIVNALSGGLNKPYVDMEGPGRLPLVEHAPLIGERIDMPMLPAEMRLPDDHYTITVEATASRVQQHYRNTDASTLSAPIELMSPVDVTFSDDPASATWAIDDRDADLEATDNTSVDHWVRATAGWLAATGATSLALHEDVPDFASYWHVYNLNHPAIALTLATRTPSSVNSVTMDN